MTMCNYNFNVPVDAESLVGLARQAIEEHGGTTMGENGHVSFTVSTPAGRLDGTCRVTEPQAVTIQITDKPDLLSCSLIREKLVTYLTEAVRIYVQRSPTV
jgi:hypothetical protein